MNICVILKSFGHSCMQSLMLCFQASNVTLNLASRNFLPTYLTVTLQRYPGGTQSHQNPHFQRMMPHPLDHIAFYLSVSKLNRKSFHKTDSSTAMAELFENDTKASSESNFSLQCKKSLAMNNAFSNTMEHLAIRQM